MLARVEAIPARQSVAAHAWFTAARNWRWLAPAAAAMAALAVWIAIRPAPPRLEQRVAQLERQVAAPPAEPGAESQAAKELAQNAPTPTDKAGGKAAAFAVAPKSGPGQVAARAPARSERKAKAGGVAPAAVAKNIAPAATAPAPTVAAGGREAESVEEFAAVPQAKVSEPAVPAKSGPALQAAAQPDKEKAAGKQSEGTARGRAAAMPVLASEPPAGKSATPQGGLNKLEDLTEYSPRPPRVLPLRSGPMLIASPGGASLWRLLPGGIIERSRDAGKTWQGQVTNVDVDLLAGSAPSESVCWVVGRVGTVLRTTDGERWERVSSPAAVDLVRVEAHDALRATVTAAGGRRYVTRDGGQSWRPK